MSVGKNLGSNLGDDLANNASTKTNSSKKISYPTNKTPENKEHFYGHRERERKRIINTPFGHVSKRDLLEVLLFYCNARSDTKPIATEILKYTGGDIRKVLFFEEHDIRNVKGLGESFLCLARVMREIMSNSFKEELMESKIAFENWNVVYDYLKIGMSHLNVEHFRMLVLGSRNELITDCLIAQGTVNHANVYIREIVKMVLDNFAVSIVLAHNHPSGDPTPSQSDIDLTKSIIAALNTISVRVQDHIIIGKDNVYSFLQNGLLN